MAQLSDSILSQLSKMDEYDRLLALDRVARENNLSVDQVKAQLQSFQQGGSQAINPGYEEMIDSTPNQPESQTSSGQPNYLQDAHRYRVRYDPSHDGQNRQSKVEHAILCPHCGAPLGIPAIRPIKVTCPNCMNEAMFEN